MWIYSIDDEGGVHVQEVVLVIEDQSIDAVESDDPAVMKWRYTETIRTRLIDVG